MSTAPIQLIIVDDHPMFREGVRFALSAFHDIEVIAEAENGTQAVELAAELQPDVVVMDLHLPGLLGVDATRQITAQSPHIAVLALTMFEDDASVAATMRAGARGYLVKGADGAAIARAVRAVAEGDIILGPRVAKHVQELLATTPAATFTELSPREREVLALLADGRNNTDIAHSLDISEKTVRNHVSNVFAKLRVADRAAAIIRAREAGLGERHDRG
ncbi:response regulator [Flexivirga alba]|uniref:Response regulator n=1 Tax=Flexivirga alba TaxID=702742 RepID=A0ABW2AHI7_9MICO